MTAFLKVKIKSLAEEARIIRKMERKLKGPKWGPSELRSSLHRHRTYDVRKEARASLVAYAFLRGRAYAQVEGSAKSCPDWAKACSIAERFSSEDKRVVRQRFFAWCDQNDPIEAKKPSLLKRLVG